MLCKAKSRLKGVFLFTDTGSPAHTLRAPARFRRRLLEPAVLPDLAEGDPPRGDSFVCLFYGFTCLFGFWFI